MKKNLLVLFLVVSCLGAYAQVPLPYSQSFEDTTFPPSGWSRFSGQADTFKWVRNTLFSAYGRGNACASFDNFDTPGGGTYGLHLSVMDFTNVTQPYFRFDVAYTTRGPVVSDALGIWCSNTDSTIGENLKNFSNGSLVTDSSGDVSMFIPQIFQWKTITLPLTFFANRPVVRISLVDSCHFGNVLYIDNIMVFDSATNGINTLIAENKLSIYPNPFDSQLNVVSEKAKRISRVEIYNSRGDLMRTQKANNTGVLINNLSILADGVYYLRIYSKDGVLNKKIVKCSGK